MRKTPFNRFSFLTLFIYCSFCYTYAQVEANTSKLDSLKQLLEQPTVLNDTFTYPNFVAPSYDSNISSYSVSNVPSPRGKGIIGYVSDPDNLIPENEELRINKLLYELEQKSSAEVAVVILPSIGVESPKAFAVELFNTWKIGKADTDNGLLILTVIEQRRTEFEVGYGLEPILTDVVCYRIGVNEIVPNFKVGAYGLGIENAVIRVKEFLENSETIDEIYGYGVYHEEQAFEWRWYHILLLFYGLLCVVFGFWYFGQAFDIERSKDDYYDKYHRLDKLKFGCLQVLFPIPIAIFGSIVSRRLKKYRYAPRFSKVNGKPMKIMNEWEENKYLEEAQMLEEKLKSVRYDVWVTEDQSDIMILEYEGPNGRKYADCKECSYKTFGKISSLILVEATYEHGGSRIDKYECRNCNYKEEKEIETPQKIRASDSSSGSSFSSSSSSSSSSSFGGGSSGGGGSGVSW